MPLLRNRSAVLVAFLVFALAAMTMNRVFASPLWGDEFRTWRDGVEKPLWTVLTWQHNPDHAPLGHLLARAGAAIFGVDHAWALRLGSWLCGLACVPAAWWLGYALSEDGQGNRSGIAVGGVVAAMLAVDPNVKLQIMQARMYMPALLCGIAATTLAGSILLRPERPWRRAVLLGVALGVGIWSHAQIYAVMIPTILLAVAMLFRDRRAARALFVGLAVACAVGAPGIRKIISRHDAEVLPGYDVSASPGSQLDDAVTKVTGRPWITVIVGISTVVGFVVLARRPRGGRLVALLALIVATSIVDVLVAGRYRPVAHARYLMLMQPPLWLAMASVVVDLWRSPQRNTLGIASAAMTAGLSGYELTRSFAVLDVPSLASAFAKSARVVRHAMAPGDRFIAAPSTPYAMYARYYGLTQDARLDRVLQPNKSVKVARVQARDEAAEDTGHATIWILCTSPPRQMATDKSLDDWQTAVRLIAEARNLAVGPLPKLSRTREGRTVVVRIDATGVTVMRGTSPTTDETPDASTQATTDATVSASR